MGSVRDNLKDGMLAMYCVGPLGEDIATNRVMPNGQISKVRAG